MNNEEFSNYYRIEEKLINYSTIQHFNHSTHKQINEKPSTKYELRYTNHRLNL